MLNEFVVMGAICSGSVIGSKIIKKAENSGNERLAQMIELSIKVILAGIIYILLSDVYDIFKLTFKL